MPLLVPLAFWVIDILITLLVVSSVMSWFRPDPRNAFVRLVHGIVDPLLQPVRALLPSTGPLDLSPLLVCLLLYVLRSLLERSFLA